ALLFMEKVRTFVEREFLQIIAVTESPEYRPDCYPRAHRPSVGWGNLWPMGHPHREESGRPGHDERSGTVGLTENNRSRNRSRDVWSSVHNNSQAARERAGSRCERN